MNARVKELWLPIAVCLAGIVLAHHEMVLSGFAVTQNDLGDTRFVHYLMEHAYRWLTGSPLHKDLWSPPFFYPITGHLAWSENMLGGAWVYFPFRMVGMDPHNAFQAWAVTVGAMNFAACYWLFRRGFEFDSVASSVGAALFAFSAVRINQTMHWQLFPHFYTPLAAFAAYRLMQQSTLTERQRVGFIALLAGAAVGQLWASIYLGWFLVFVFAVGLAIGLCWQKTRTELVALVKGQPWTLVLVSLASIALLYPLGWRYYEVAKQFGGRPFEEVLTMLPRATTWLHMGKSSWFWGSLAAWPTFQGISMEHEQRCGFGLIASGLALAAIVMFRKEQRLLFVGLLLGVLLVLTTLYSTDGTTPWRYVHAYFPAAQAIRAVARASIVYMLGVAALVAAALHWVGKHEKLKLLAIPLGAVLVLEQGYDTPAFSKADNRRDIDAVAASIEPGCEVFVMSPLQGYGPYWKYQLDAMWGSVMAGVPTMNGYSGQSPKDWALGDTDLRSGNDEPRVMQGAQMWLQQQPKLQKLKPCWARVGFNEGPNYVNQFVSQSVPAAMLAGQTVPIEISFKNLGTRPWPIGIGLRLGSEAPQDNNQWGVQRVELPQETPPGGTATFRFNVQVPTQPGKRGFQWRMVHDGVQWLGEASKMVVVDVLAPEAPPPAPETTPDAG